MEVENRFKILQEENVSNSSNIVYNNFIIAHHEPAKMHITLKLKIIKCVPENQLKLQKKEKT